MMILHELNTVLKYDYLPLDEALAAMRAIKHPYREQGVKAQRGEEF